MRRAFYFSVFLLSQSVLFGSPNPLQELDQRVTQELQALNLPAQPWITAYSDREEILDVAIIGGGQMGLAAAFMLQCEGIDRIKIFDASPAGLEGPWITTARMRCLRSDKSDAGPACGIPSLTFRAWYEAQWGAAAWHGLKNCSTHEWQHYLHWYRRTLKLPLENDILVENLEPEGDLWKLTCVRYGRVENYLARKVILATGRLGFGGPIVPKWLAKIPNNLYAHTTDPIDFDALRGKRIAIIGAGASAFDAAAVALEHRAKSVHLLVRGDHVNRMDPLAAVAGEAFRKGYSYLSDEQRWQFISHIVSQSMPPPRTALLRVKKYPNIHLLTRLKVESAASNGAQVTLQTNQGEKTYDFIIAACGFDIDSDKRSELHSFADDILRWRDRLFCTNVCPKLGRSPYLDEGFAFQERFPGAAPHVKNVYCLNYGALVSHGLIMGDIEGVSVAAKRVAEHIAVDFLRQELTYIYQQMLEMQEPMFFEEDLPGD
jgi:cation diffusion facilitator CzcD-associated flavoprotein CzcO